jgi:hypothetical protein
MSVDIGRIVETITGAKATPADIQKFMAISAATGVPVDDPMFAFYVALDQQYRVYSDLPKRIEAAGVAVEKTSGEITRQIVERAAAQAQAAIASEFDGRAVGFQIAGIAALAIAAVAGAALWALVSLHRSVDEISAKAAQNTLWAAGQMFASDRTRTAFTLAAPRLANIVSKLEYEQQDRFITDLADIVIRMDQTPEPRDRQAHLDAIKIIAGVPTEIAGQIASMTHSKTFICKTEPDPPVARDEPRRR